MAPVPTCLPINIFIVSPLGRFSTSIGCKCLCDSKNIKNILLAAHKNSFTLFIQKKALRFKNGNANLTAQRSKMFFIFLFYFLCFCLNKKIIRRRV